MLSAQKQETRRRDEGADWLARLWAPVRYGARLVWPPPPHPLDGKFSSSRSSPTELALTFGLLLFTASYCYFGHCIILSPQRRERERAARKLESERGKETTTSRVTLVRAARSPSVSGSAASLARRWPARWPSVRKSGRKLARVTKKAGPRSAPNKSRARGGSSSSLASLGSLSLALLLRLFCPLLSLSLSPPPPSSSVHAHRTRSLRCAQVSARTDHSLAR